MEQKHLKRLREQFSETMRSKPVAVLEIPDRYRYMDPELIGELQRSVNPILEQALQGGGQPIGLGGRPAEGKGKLDIATA